MNAGTGLYFWGRGTLCLSNSIWGKLSLCMPRECRYRNGDTLHMQRRFRHRRYFRNALSATSRTLHYCPLQPLLAFVWTIALQDLVLSLALILAAVRARLVPGLAPVLSRQLPALVGQILCTRTLRKAGGLPGVHFFFCDLRSVCKFVLCT